LRIDRAIIIGFLAIPGALLAQNWNFQSTGTPPARDGAAMVYDPVHHQTLLFGGEDSSGTPHNDTWVYNGTNWAQLSPATSPTPRLWHSMAFNGNDGTIVLFGGCANNTCTPGYLGDTWIWNGTTWSNPAPVGNPTPRQSAAMAYGSATGLILFGGLNSQGVLGDQYFWNGTTWNTPEVEPPTARFDASMSYDSVNQLMVLFGGIGTGGPLNDVWQYNGTSWTQ